MSKVKARIITLLSLFMLIALVLGFVFSPVSLREASADSTYNITGGSDGIFAAKTSGSAKGEVLAYKTGTGEDADAFVMFVIDNGGSVAYERDLALKWYSGTAKDLTGKEEFFRLTFAAVLKDGTVPFDTFSIEFESKEENITKDGKATNVIVFEKGEGEGTLQVYVKNADFTGDEEAEKQIPRTEIADATKDITLSLGNGSSAGEFAVKVENNGETKEAGKLTNVGGNYLEYYSSSSSTPNVPMTFKATAAEGQKARIFMKELNGQSLKVTGGTEETTDDGVQIKDGKITDNADPVLVLNEAIYSYTLGQKFTHDCKVIDVCKKSITSPTHEYYMAPHKDGVFTNPTAKKETITDSDGNSVEKETGDYDGYKTLTTSTHFMPSDDHERDDFTEYVSIRVRLRDDRSETAWAYLHWYAVDGAKTTGTDAEENAFPYIKVEDKKEGPRYIENNNDTAFDDAVKAYQEAVTAAAGKEDVSAGSGAYFYLPSLRNLIKSDYADYRNLRFSIYYYKQSQSEGSSAGSATSLKYNALRFQIDEAGMYKFRVLATDAAGNAMKFPQQKEGEPTEYVTVSSSNIWDLEGYPEFTLEVKYNGVTIEDMKEQTSGNRESSYSITDFTIIALSGIQKDYSLYYFNEGNLKTGATAPTYSALVSEMNEIKTPEAFAEFCAKYDVSSDRKCITEISEFNSDIAEDDDEWDNTDNAYRWNPSSSLSFVPQKSGFYIVGITVTDPNRSNESHVAYQAIRIGNPYDYTPAPSDWLQNNLVSVILFSISGVLLIAIVILFIVKPSDKKMEEIDLDKLKGKKKKK